MPERRVKIPVKEIQVVHWLPTMKMIHPFWSELSVGASDAEIGIGPEYTLGYRNSRTGLYGTLITEEDDYCNAEFKIFVV